MTEELQQLIDRIRKEGVEKARDEAKAIVAHARQEAEETAAKAKAEAETFQKEAQREADAFTRRAEQSVRQAARDVLIQVEQDLAKRIEALLSREVAAAAADETAFRKWVSDAVTAYLKGGDDEVEVVLGGAAAEQAAGLVERLRAEAASADGIKVSPNPVFPNGFTIRLQGGRVEHSFTTEAITAALARLLRPQLVKLLTPAE
jgi:V/A-type H+/Na+-transporting ATPase subunit E